MAISTKIGKEIVVGKGPGGADGGVSVPWICWEEPNWGRTSVGIRGWLSASEYVLEWLDGRW